MKGSLDSGIQFHIVPVARPSGILHDEPSLRSNSLDERLESTAQISHHLDLPRPNTPQNLQPNTQPLPIEKSKAKMTCVNRFQPTRMQS